MNNETFVLGVEKLDYTSKKTKQRVVGCVVYVGQTIDNGTKSVANVFIRNSDIADFPIGRDCKVYYNQFGTPCEVVML